MEAQTKNVIGTHLLAIIFTPWPAGAHNRTFFDAGSTFVGRALFGWQQLGPVLKITSFCLRWSRAAAIYTAGGNASEVLSNALWAGTTRDRGGAGGLGRRRLGGRIWIAKNGSGNGFESVFDRGFFEIGLVAGLPSGSEFGFEFGLEIRVERRVGGEVEEGETSECEAWAGGSSGSKIGIL